MYRLEVSPAADQDLEKLPGHMTRRAYAGLSIAVRSLRYEPRPQNTRKIKGAGNACCIEAGGWRIIYEIYDKENLVLILKVVRVGETTYLSND